MTNESAKSATETPSETRDLNSPKLRKYQVETPSTYPDGRPWFSSCARLVSVDVRLKANRQPFPVRAVGYTFLTVEAAKEMEANLHAAIVKSKAYVYRHDKEMAPTEADA